MTNLLNVTVERGMLIDVSGLSDKQINDIEESLRDNNASPEEIAKQYSLSIKYTAYDAQVTLQTN